MSLFDEIAKRATPTDVADFPATTLGRHFTSVREGKSPLLVFGAGSAGRRMVALFLLHGYDVAAVIDNDTGKHGQKLDASLEGLYFGQDTVPRETINGPEILGIETAQIQFPKALIVLAVGNLMQQKTIREQLRKSGFDDERILAVPSAAMMFYNNVPQWYWRDEELAAHEHKLSEAFSSFADEASRALFVSRIALFMRGADFSSYERYLKTFSLLQQDGSNPPRHPSYYYFSNDVIRMGKNETLIDCGAYDGDSLKEFLLIGDASENSRYTAHCMEPDAGNFQQLSSVYLRHPRVRLHNTGVWSHQDTIFFEGSETPQRSMKANAQVCQYDSGVKIEVDAIDNIFRDCDVSMIKMDIEGSELQALEGAKQTIRRCRPKLAISAYHHRQDLFDLPIHIRSNHPDYNLYLRLCNNDWSDVVLFAIPQETPQ